MKKRLLLRSLVAMHCAVACLNAHASPSVDVKPQTAATNDVLVADEKSGSWWGYSQTGGVTLCSRDGFDEMSPGWGGQCKPKESGTPVTWQVIQRQMSAGGGSAGFLGLVD